MQLFIRGGEFIPPDCRHFEFQQLVSTGCQKSLQGLKPVSYLLVPRPIYRKVLVTTMASHPPLGPADVPWRAVRGAAFPKNSSSHLCHPPPRVPSVSSSLSHHPLTPGTIPKGAEASGEDMLWSVLTLPSSPAPPWPWGASAQTDVDTDLKALPPGCVLPA